MVWYPPHNSVPTSLNTFSCFDQVKYNNNRYVITDEHINTSFIKTIKLKIYPTDNQITIFNDWFSLVNNVYNYTNQYIKDNICKINCLQEKFPSFLNHIHLLPYQSKFLLFKHL